MRELPYGRQRLVEIAIALALRPKVLLLDEPAAGVPSSESHLILDVIARLDPDIAILIIEHDMDVVFRFAKRITVLVQGAVLTEGTPAEIVADERVRAVYLGEEVRAMANAAALELDGVFGRLRRDRGARGRAPRARARARRCRSSAATASARPRCSRP